MYGTDATYTFALKALMKDQSLFLISLMLLSVMLVFGYNVRLFEREVQEDFSYLSTSFWFCLVTMTTVGYGDYFPLTHSGRTITILMAFCGNFIVSLFVVSLTNMLEFIAPEKRAYSLLVRLKSKDDQRIFGLKVVASVYKTMLMKKGSVSSE
jgi:hypothetical protein